MQTILVVIHIIITLCLVGVILLQRTNSDGLSGVGSGSSFGGIMSPAFRANFMTKLTSVLAAAFIIACLVLSNLAARSSKKSIVEETHASTHTKTIPLAE
jgi:preprotein translocase subunit SecG